MSELEFSPGFGTIDLAKRPFVNSRFPVKPKVRYFVEVDQVQGKTTILMTASELRSALEDILKAENIRCVNYYADGMPMQRYLDEGKALRDRIDQLLGIS